MQDDTLTVEDVLTARAEFDHELNVRSIGPAICLVLERDAPLRMETSTTTEAEFHALQESCSNDWRFKELLDLYFALKEAEEGDLTSLWTREDEHVERLDEGRRMENLRVSEIASNEEADPHEPEPHSIEAKVGPAAALLNCLSAPLVPPDAWWR